MPNLTPVDALPPSGAGRPASKWSPALVQQLQDSPGQWHQVKPDPGEPPLTATRAASWATQIKALKRLHGGRFEASTRAGRGQEPMVFARWLPETGAPAVDTAA